MTVQKRHNGAVAMNSAQDQVQVLGEKEGITKGSRCTTQLTLTRLQDLLRPKIIKPSYPPISSVPRISAYRLAASDALPSPFPDKPIPATSLPSTYTPPGGPPTVLYLAYGSNLCAQTFLGQRGIRPISQVNVSCPSLDLTFDLPGIPYLEPCFANTAPRKVPKTPPKLPPEIPKVPPKIPDVPKVPPPPPPIKWNETEHDERRAKEPVWDKGLIGVVYEVTKSDYAHIVATEGGGLGYKDILVPCLPLPASVGVPERPPEIPIPFLAHTLFAPQIPNTPDDDDDDDDNNEKLEKPTPSQLENQSKLLHKDRAADDEDDDKPTPPKPPTPPDLPKLISKLPPSLQKLFLPRSRAKSHPFEPYAQPSQRYLSLLVTGAFEHDLPQDYQNYLASLQPYTITTFQQRIARYLVLVFLGPIMLLLMWIGQRFFADPKTGLLPLWFGLIMNFVGNLTWGGYDALGKKVFGDGERTMDEDDDDNDDDDLNLLGKKRNRAKENGLDMEKQSLLAQNMLLRDW